MVVKYGLAIIELKPMDGTTSSVVVILAELQCRVHE